MQAFLMLLKCFSIQFTILLNILFYSNILAQSADFYIKKGDEFAGAFEIQQAFDEYMKAFKADTSNCKVLWKIAETYINLGEETEKNKRVQYYYTAEKWARKTVSICPDEANGHFFIAVASGKLALYEGGRRKVNRSKEVKAEAEKALELQPNHHGAYHVLGRWHREIANLSWILKVAAKIIYGGVPPGASNQAAVTNFKKAIESMPEWINHHKQLGLTYMEMKKWQSAKEEFETVLELSVLDHEDEYHKKVSKKLLDKANEKLK